MRKPEYDIWFTKGYVDVTHCRLYTRRWFLLFLFVLYAASGVIHWAEYCTIADVVVKFYNVSYDATGRTWVLFILIFIMLSPYGWHLLEKLSFRWTIVGGMIVTTVAAWMKVVATTPDRFWLVLLAQAIAGMAQIVMLPAIPKFAATWFGPNEVSTACAIGIFGILLGNTVGVTLPHAFVNIAQRILQIQVGLQNLHITISVFSSMLLILLVRYLEEKPPVPPSPAQMRILYEGKPVTITSTLKKLLYMRSYWVLLVSYSINTASMCTLLRLFSQILFYHFKFTQYLATSVFLVVTFSGMVGCIVSGIILDTYKKFWTTALVTYIISFAAAVCLTVALMDNLLLVYITAAVLGYSMSGTLAIGFELAIELTYPEPPTVPCGLLVAVAQVLGIIFTLVYSCLMDNVGATFANLAISGALLIGSLLIVFIPKDYKRQEAQIKIVEI